MTLNNPIDEVLLLGNKDGSVAPSGLVQLATLALAVQGTPSVATLITARVAGLITCSACDGNDDETSAGLGALVPGTDAGPGYVSLGGGRRRSLVELAASLRHRPARRSLAAEGTCCSGAFASAGVFGDT